MGDAHQEVVRKQFGRAAETFAERTRGRFDALGVVEFSRVPEGATVAEVGAGGGNFLGLFAERAGRLIAVDLTEAMLAQARSRFPQMNLVAGDGTFLPIRSRAIDLVTTAQALHHVWRPVELLKEMRRVVAPGGRVLIVDSVASERYEEMKRMNELDRIRDPSHAAFRSPSAMRVIVRAAGLRIVDERIREEEQTLSNWMWPGEFEEARIARVRDFIERWGHETGLGFERRGEDWAFTRRRLMILAEREGPGNL